MKLTNMEHDKWKFAQSLQELKDATDRLMKDCQLFSHEPEIHDAMDTTQRTIKKNRSTGNISKTKLPF